MWVSCIHSTCRAPSVAVIPEQRLGHTDGLKAHGWGAPPESLNWCLSSCRRACCGHTVLCPVTYLTLGCCAFPGSSQQAPSLCWKTKHHNNCATGGEIKGISKLSWLAGDLLGDICRCFQTTHYAAEDDKQKTAVSGELIWKRTASPFQIW